MSDVSQTPLAPGDFVTARYRLESILGTGGFGAVWRATDVASRTPVAIKLLAQTENDTQIARFKDEFALLTKLAHPHINPVYDFGKDARAGYFFTSALVEGKSLFEVCATLEFPAMEELIVQGLRALNYLHQHGVHHFDIKPQNLLVETDAHNNLTLKVIDFGLAALRPIAQKAGTPSYMAPELIVGAPADGRADLYALGVTFTACVARQNPFRAANARATWERHLTLTPPPLSSTRDGVPPYIDGFVARLLAKTPSERFASAAHALRELFLLSPASYPMEIDATREAYVPAGNIVIGQYAGKAAIRALLRPSVTEHSSLQFLVLQGERHAGKTTMLHYARVAAALAECEVVTVSGPDDPQRDFLTAQLTDTTSDARAPLVLLIDDVDACVAHPQLAPFFTQLWMKAASAHWTRPLWIIATATRSVDLPAHVVAKRVPLARFSAEDIAQYLRSITPITPHDAAPLVTQLQHCTGGVPGLVAHAVRAMLTHASHRDTPDLATLALDESLLSISEDTPWIEEHRTLFATLSEHARTVLAIIWNFAEPLPQEWLATCARAEGLTAAAVVAAVHELHAAQVIQEIVASSIPHDDVERMMTMSSSSHNASPNILSIPSMEYATQIALADFRVSDALRAITPPAESRRRASQMARALAADGVSTSIVDRLIAYGDDAPAAQRALLTVCDRDARAGHVLRAIARLEERITQLIDIDDAHITTHDAHPYNTTNATHPHITAHDARTRTTSHDNLAAMITLACVAARWCVSAEQSERGSALIHRVLACHDAAHDVTSLHESLQVAYAELYEWHGVLHLRSGALTPADAAFAVAECCVNAATSHDAVAALRLRLANHRARQLLDQGKLQDAHAAYATNWRATLHATPTVQSAVTNHEYGQCELLLGNAGAAATQLQKELALLDAHTHPLRVAAKLVSLAGAHQQLGAAAAANAALQRALTLTTPSRDARMLSAIYMMMGNLAISRADLDAALQHLDRALQAAYRAGDVAAATRITLNSAKIRTERGDIAVARAELGTALACIAAGKIDARTAARLRCPIFQLLGELARLAHDFVAAHEALARALQIAEDDTTARTYLGGIFLTLAELAHDETNSAKAREWLTRAEPHCTAGMLKLQWERVNDMITDRVQS